jgi:hypothetical protein
MAWKPHANDDFVAYKSATQNSHSCCAGLVVACDVINQEPGTKGATPFLAHEW